jgi:ABC-type nitrate/sulfonate/bicarbonate transport system ATPase subunit
MSSPTSAATSAGRPAPGEDTDRREETTGADTGSSREPARLEASPHGGGELAVEQVSHRYVVAGRATPVLDNVSFTIPAGHVACVVGPSGCGKTTLLGLAAGLLAPSSGRLVWDGEPVRLGPNRHIGMAFQQPGLFPWLTVLQNVAIGLRTRGHSRRDARRIAEEFLATVGLADFQDAHPSQLSGGMAQRVGIARALALRPRLLLLDEPFAAVDAFTRLKLQQELLALLKRYRPTVMFVTHDVPEAIVLGDFIVVMTERPATVRRIIPVNPEERNRTSVAFARKLADTLECLGVTTGVAGE